MTLHDYTQSLAVQAEDLLSKSLDLPENQILFFSLRTQAEAAVTRILGASHQAVHELQHLLGIPTADSLLRIVGILRGCVVYHTFNMS